MRGQGEHGEQNRLARSTRHGTYKHSRKRGVPVRSYDKAHALLLRANAAVTQAANGAGEEEPTTIDSIVRASQQTTAVSMGKSKPALD